MSLYSLRVMIAQKDDLTVRIHKEIKRFYHPGKNVEFERGGKTIYGWVKDTSMDRVKIYNPKTQKEYWIYVHDLLK